MMVEESTVMEITQELATSLDITASSIHGTLTPSPSTTSTHETMTD